MGNNNKKNKSRKEIDEDRIKKLDVFNMVSPKDREIEKQENFRLMKQHKANKFFKNNVDTKDNTEEILRILKRKKYLRWFGLGALAVLIKLQLIPQQYIDIAASIIFGN